MHNFDAPKSSSDSTDATNPSLSGAASASIAATDEAKATATATADQLQPCVLVLASGRGARFAASGGTVHKLHAPLADSTVLQHTLKAVRASGLPWHVEDAGHPGMGDSIAAAVGACTDASGWLVLPGDLPLISPSTLRQMADALFDCAVAVPVYAGERGHPVAFAASCRPALLALAGEQGAAEIVRQHAAAGHVKWVDVFDVGTVTDVDTLEDLERAERLLAQRNIP